MHISTGPCPNGSLPCGFNFSNCWVPEQACDGVNDCGDELAYDEIPGFVELSGESCITDGGSGSGFLGGTNDCKKRYFGTVLIVCT